MHYVGMDCHITTLDFAVVDDAGRLVKSCKVDTSAKNFMEFVKSVAAPRIVYMEESALAASNRIFMNLYRDVQHWSVFSM